MKIGRVMWNIFSDVLHQASPAEKYITINNQAILLHKKEQEIYKKTIKFEKEYSLFLDFDYLFYDFQILCEFIEKYKEDFWIKYNWELPDLLGLFSLVLRFLRLWYYETSWMYLRKSFEEWSKIFCLDDGKKNCKNKVEWIINAQKSDGWPMMFEIDEVYKLYTYLSEKYSHYHWNFTDIKFDKNKFIEIENLTIILIVTISNMTINLTSMEWLTKHWNDKIDNPVDDYNFYWAYVWPLTRSAFVSGCHFRFVNSLQWTQIQKFEFKNWEKWLILNKWIKNFDNYC